MVDEESQDVASAPAGGAPVNRDRLRDPDVIDGEAIRVEPDTQATSAAEATGAETPLGSPPPDRRAPGALRPLAFGALGGLIVSALALAGGYYALAPKADLAQADAGRLGALEAAGAARGRRRLSDRAPRSPVSTSASALWKRRAPGSPPRRRPRKAPRPTVKSLKAGRGRAQRATLPRSPFASRNWNPARPKPAPLADTAALAARVDKVEAALAAPKAETRAAPETPAAGGNPAAVAIVAAALRDKLAAGIPFAAELTALQSLGVEPDKLTPLQALAGGGPTDRALASSFDAVAPKVLAASSSPRGGGVIDRFLAHLRGLVQVRVLNETQGDDPGGAGVADRGRHPARRRERRACRLRQAARTRPPGGERLGGAGRREGGGGRGAAVDTRSGDRKTGGWRQALSARP